MTEPVRIILPSIFPMQTVNAWLFKEPEPILIDCGENTPQNWQALDDQLNQQGLKIADLKKVYITHAHVDHMGMAGRIASEAGVEIWVNEYSKPWALDIQKMWNRRAQMFQGAVLNHLEKMKGGEQVTQTMKSVFDSVLDIWVNVPIEKVRVFPANGSVSFGGEQWQSIYVPGHSNTQNMFYEPEKKWLLSADMLLKITPSPVIDAQIEDPTKREKALPRLLESFKKLSTLDIVKVFPGHYEIIENPYEIIDNQVYRIHKRKEQVFDLIENGTSSFLELFKIMYNGQMNFPGLGMLLGYLDLLLKEQRIQQKTTDGILFETLED